MAAGSLAQLYISQADPSQEHFASDCRKVIWLDALNMGPTLAVLLTAFAFFSLLSLFLDTYVATAEQSIAVFAIGSYVVFTSYFTFHYYLEKFSTSYKNVEPDKQFYVLSNLIKSATLLSYTPLAAIVLYKTMVLDDWNTTRIRNLGCMYAIPDFVSLFLVKRMSNTTIVHHLAVCVFNVVSMFNDYGEENVCRLMVVYAIFSTFAYLVNLLLASRFLNIPKWVAQYMSGMALLIYASCCGINWTWQTIYTWKLLQTGHTYPVTTEMDCCKTAMKPSDPFLNLPLGVRLCHADPDGGLGRSGPDEVALVQGHAMREEKAEEGREHTEGQGEASKAAVMKQANSKVSCASVVVIACAPCWEPKCCPLFPWFIFVVCQFASPCTHPALQSKPICHHSDLWLPNHAPGAIFR